MLPLVELHTCDLTYAFVEFDFAGKYDIHCHSGCHSDSYSHTMTVDEIGLIQSNCKSKSTYSRRLIDLDGRRTTCGESQTVTVQLQVKVM
jgi:hypothetical protein